jgi:hypothetical protein
LINKGSQVRHGDQATAKAREMVEQKRRKGDTEGADTWLRIIVAIGHAGRINDRRAALICPPIQPLLTMTMSRTKLRCIYTAKRHTLARGRYLLGVSGFWRQSSRASTFD